MLNPMGKLYPISKFAKEIGVTTTTLRNWHKREWLIPAKITNSGARYYSEKQLREYLGISESEEINIEQ